MSDKNINISINTKADTSGAQQAEDAIKKVGEEASKGADFNPMVRSQAELDASIEKTNQAADAAAKHEEALRKAAEAGAELEEKLGELQDELEKTTESTEDAAKGASELEKNVEGISRAQKGQIIAQLAQGVGKIADKFRQAASEVREFDADAADSFESTANRIDTVTTSVSALAMGFAAGGPLGAGVAGIGLLIGGLVNAFKEAEVAAIKAAAVGKKGLEIAREVARDAAREAKNLADELANEAIARNIQAQNDKLAEGLQLIREQVIAARQRRAEQEEILKADDKIKLADIDEAEAKGDITSVDAARQRQDVSVNAQKRANEERKKVAQENADIAVSEAQKERQAFILRAQELEDAKAKLLENEQEMKAARRVVLGTQAKKELDALEELDFATTDSVFKSAGQAQIARAKKEAKEAQIAKAGFTVKEQLTDPEKAKQDLIDANLKVNEARKKVQEAQDAVAKQAKAAQDAERNEISKKQGAFATVRTVDTAASKEDQARETKNRADAIRRQREEEERQRIQSQREADRISNSQRDLEANITGIGRDAAEATRGIGGGINPEEFNRIATKIARKGDLEGDKLNLTSFLEKISRLVDAIPDSKAASADAEKLREVERKLEKKLSDLQLQFKNNRS